jgi:glycine/D-amino acid oxidase-like deaminating enzyme
MEGDAVSMRYFLADPVAYEQARAALNAAWGIPRPGTETSLPVASELMTSGGRVVVMVDDWMTALPPAPEIVAQAIAAGTLEEISEASVRAMLPQTP